MSDKVRFYLEQSVGELEELHEKGLFSKPELGTIMKKRSNFEYTINSSRPKPKDYLRYVEYEINVDRLRAKRSKRLLGTSSGSGMTRYSGKRRVFFIFDRATQKLSGNIPLWMQYLEYAKSQKAHNVITKIFTSILQLHPTKPKLWVLAAKYEAEENASIISARTVLQRGLRFNSNSEFLWLEYIKLELIYISKILTRRRILGISDSTDQTAQTESSIELTDEDLEQANKLDLPDVNISALGSVENNPALRGDIALAVYDSAMTVLSHPEDFSVKVENLFIQFSDLDRLHLLDHIGEYLRNHNYGSTAWILGPLKSTEITSIEFPDMVKLMITRYRKNKNDCDSNKVKEFIDELLEKDIDDNIKIVLRSFIKSIKV